jgi:uncharacterized protein YaiE (UPF0345 family)
VLLLEAQAAIAQERRRNDRYTIAIFTAELDRKDAEIERLRAVLGAIVKRLRQDNDFAVFIAGDGMPALRLMSEADRRDALAEWADRFVVVGDDPHIIEWDEARK